MGDRPQDRSGLDRVDAANRDEDWMLDTSKIGRLDAELEHLQDLADELPSHLHDKLRGLRGRGPRAVPHADRRHLDRHRVWPR